MAVLIQQEWSYSMLDKDLISVHVHLFYLEPSIYLLDKISEYYNGPIYISLNEDGANNEEIELYAVKKFKKVKSVTVKNKGNDQYGFYSSFKQNDEETPWILYCHDKTIKRIDWLDRILDPVLQYKDMEKTLNNEKNGMISSGDPEYYLKMINEEDLTALSKTKNFSGRLEIMQSRHTLTWFRELQYILLSDTGFINAENLNPNFTAGNMFLARRPVVKMSHQCIHESFFEDYYRPDGNVEHAMERFYFYVSECLKYKNVFIGAEEPAGNHLGS